MKSARIESFGGPDVLTVASADARELRADEAVVRVEAASLNPLDVKIVSGDMQAVFPVAFPYIVGSDFSGTVEAVGRDVTHVRPGDRVAARTAPTDGGALAQRLTIAASELHALPDDMSFEQAAAVPTAFGTACQALFDAGHLQAGQRVLIHAGAGGVGSFAVQLARQAGAHVIATASGANRALVDSLGAHEVIDYRQEDFTRLRDIDLVLDPLGGETLAKSWQVLREGGRIVTLVAFDIEDVDGRSGEAMFFSSANPALPKAMQMFRGGQLQIVIDSIHPLDEARAALERVASGHARGKVLVRIGA